jgi:hypothetical protein
MKNNVPSLGLLGWPSPDHTGRSMWFAVIITVATIIGFIVYDELYIKPKEKRLHEQYGPKAPEPPKSLGVQWN